MTSVTGSRTLYVSDLDGTLLRSDGSVSAGSARALNAAIDAGALFTYATARSFLSSRMSTERLHLTLPVITYGGTVTADPGTGAHRDLRLLDAATVEAALHVCAHHDASVEPILFTYEDGRDWIRWRPERMTAGARSFLDARTGDPRLRPVTREDPLDRTAVFYVSIIGASPGLAALRDALRPSLTDAAHFLSIDDGTPGLDWLEFHHAEGTKARAVQRLMVQLGADRLVVFGDNHNDVPMFEIADESYAVSNAVPAVRELATGVIGSNDDDAVALWLADRVVDSPPLRA
ncbi:HAD family hydrolase [Agromyces larvae]|uniref:Cof-type HAD-IIB family hydrolase n=1 Tax=Agromyces larvae TaxID=2929802 RepID=A0ABY4C4Z0_9MICO|nr:HAD family hydrolase [Agromyces larvae]UOE45058.1 Cof-type HAD-IIB family hydrolase [Agromyces larvae]